MSTYLNSGPMPYYPVEGERYPGFSWEDYTFQRLVWFHGSVRAGIIAMGQDRATNADLAAWNRLGKPLRRMG